MSALRSAARFSAILPGMSTSSDAPIPQTDDGAELLEAYRDLDDADRVQLWSALLTELDRRPTPDKEPSEAAERRP